MLRKIIIDKPSLFKDSKIYQLYFEKLGGINYFISSLINIQSQSCPTLSSRFWTDVSKYWLDLKHKNDTNISHIHDVMKEPLFNNANIAIKDKPLFSIPG